MLLGVIVTGIFVAISMTSGRRAPGDNAKKYIEDGHYGGKGSDAAQGGGDRRHRWRSLQGYGRARLMNPMIKITNIVALLLLAVLAHWR